MTQAQKLLRELIALPSVNNSLLPPGHPRAGEKRVVDFLTAHAARAGLDVRLQKVLPGRSNLLARLTPVMFISGGGLPIWRGNQLIGAIGSSGAHGEGPIGQLDAVCARAGLEAISPDLR